MEFSQWISIYESNSDLLSVEAPMTQESHNNQEVFASRFESNMSELDNFNISQYLTFGEPEVEEIEVQSESQESEVCEMEDEGKSLDLQTPTVSQDFESRQQNFKENPQNQLLVFHKTHIISLTKRKTPIFPQSRKINKTKKKNHHNQSYYGFVDKKMNKPKGFTKKFDQKLQNQFEKLSIEEQEEKDLTYEALRHLEESPDAESKTILEAYEAKYLKKRSQAIFLDKFVTLA